MKKLTKTVCLSLLVLGLLSPMVAAQAPSVLTGVFTAGQAERGEAAYTQACAGCHGADLVTTTDPEAPGLAGFSFTLQWVGKTAAERFERIKTTMPAGAAGSLSDQTYLDIIAFILSFNGYPAGALELTPEVDLGAITITRVP